MKMTDSAESGGNQDDAVRYADDKEVAVYPMTVWKIDCPRCGDTLIAAEDECQSGVAFTAECSACDHTFPARPV